MIIILITYPIKYFVCKGNTFFLYMQEKGSILLKKLSTISYSFPICGFHLFVLRTKIPPQEVRALILRLWKGWQE